MILKKFWPANSRPRISLTDSISSELELMYMYILYICLFGSGYEWENNGSILLFYYRKYMCQINLVKQEK